MLPPSEGARAVDAALPADRTLASERSDATGHPVEGHPEAVTSAPVDVRLPVRASRFEDTRFAESAEDGSASLDADVLGEGLPGDCLERVLGQGEPAAGLAGHRDGARPEEVTKDV